MTANSELESVLEKMGAKNIGIGGWYVVFDYEGRHVELQATTVRNHKGAGLVKSIQPQVESKSIDG